MHVLYIKPKMYNSLLSQMKPRLQMIGFMVVCGFMGLLKGLALKNTPEIHENIGNALPARDTSLYRRATVTGASSNHFNTLVQFLNNYKTNGQNIPLVVYDLGLSDTELAIVHNKFSWATVRTFNFSQYPPYFMLDNDTRGEYAWKPIIVKEMLDTTTSAVLWLDSGDRLTSTHSLEDTFSLIERDGHVTATSVGTTQMWVHPSTLAFFHEPNLNIGMCNAAIVGFDMRAYEDVVTPWAACALERVCIAPPGATRKNHRQDQSILTLLLHQAGRKYGINTGMPIIDYLYEHFMRSLGRPSGLGILIQTDNA
jgi:Protein of unknown function (DUF1647)